MFVCELAFECFENTTITKVEKAVNGLMDALRFNGQVYGREFPLAMNEATFTVRCVCPEQESLHPRNHSDFVNFCLERLSEAGVLSPKVKLIGQDINSEQTAEDEVPSWQILYTPMYIPARHFAVVIPSCLFLCIVIRQHLMVITSQ